MLSIALNQITTLCPTFSSSRAEARAEKATFFLSKTEEELDFGASYLSFPINLKVSAAHQSLPARDFF